MSCCVPYNLGCYQSCDTINLLSGQEPGDYQLEIDFAGVVEQHDITVDVYGELNIDLSLFNEASCSTFKILKPDSEYVTVTVKDDVFECFQVSIKPIYK